MVKLYGFNKMEYIKAPVNVWDKYSIRPGAVGSVGEANIQVRLRQSAPHMAPRYAEYCSKGNEKYYGSNVSDGYHAGFTSGGGVASVVTRPMPYRQGFKTAVGWVKEDILPTDRSRMAIMGKVGSIYSEQVAELKQAKTSGEYFLPLPGQFKLGEGQTPRGSQIPRVVAMASESTLLDPIKAGVVTDVEYGRGNVPGSRLTREPEYVVDQNIYWTAPANDPRRVTMPDPINDAPDPSHHPEFVKVIYDSPIWGKTFGWLDDTNEPQSIYDVSRGSYTNGIASRRGGIGRPAKEKVPIIEVPMPIPGGTPAPPNRPAALGR